MLWHRDEAIKEAARNNNIEQFVPDRCAESCQPIDIQSSKDACNANFKKQDVGTKPDYDSSRHELCSDIRYLSYCALYGRDMTC